MCDTVSRLTAVALQETNKENIEILKQNKARLKNDVRNITTNMNSDSTPGIYLTAIKVSQYIMVAENRREKEEAKK